MTDDSDYIDVVNESVIEYETTHTGMFNLELEYSHITYDYELNYEITSSEIYE